MLMKKALGIYAEDFCIRADFLMRLDSRKDMQILKPISYRLYGGIIEDKKRTHKQTAFLYHNKH